MARSKETPFTLAQQYAPTIEFVADCLFRGDTVANLTAQGNHNDAAVLATHIDALNELKLMGLVERRVNFLKFQSAPVAPETPPFFEDISPPPFSPHEPQYHKLGFAGLDPQGWLGLKPDASAAATIKDLLDNPEAAIDQMHQMQRRNNHLPNHAIAAELARDWRRLLKQWGALTWSQKRQRLGTDMTRYVELFQILGVWDQIRDNLDQQTIVELQQLLGQDRRTQRDPSSSEGITTFASDLAWALDQIQD